MAAKEETKLSVDNIKARDSYVGRKSGNKIIVTLVEQFSVRYHYVYPNGSRMTADQEEPRSLFIRKFCRSTERQQELL